ncbi:MAG: hypothetical protein LQ352_001280 [Teloschistes flavicans]|nr:MAG: hypothetical protein LQ352_001280 [Teloschistes flavicans]
MDRPMSLKITPDVSSSSDPRLPSPRLKPSIPANIPIQSFSAFQANTPQVNGPSPVRRKPLPTSASVYSPKVPPLSTGGQVVAVGEEDPDEIYTASPFGQSFARFPWKRAPASSSPPLVVRDLDHFPRGHSPQNVEPSQNPLAPAATNRSSLPVSNQNGRTINGRLASESMLHEGSKFNSGVNGTNNTVQRAMSLSTATRPSALHINGDKDSFYESNDPATIVKTPRSPGPSKLASFFGLRGSSPIAEQSPTSKSHSPGPSPLLPSPHAMDASRHANGTHSSYFADTSFPMPPGTPAMSVQIGDMEEELRDISAELAGSIRRELELEDIVDRLQYEAQQGPELGRRTSDYFSDSGTSSIRYPPSDVSGYKAEDHAKMKRASEQEKARYKLDMSQKLQDERGRRKTLELHIRQLSSQVQHIDQERAAASSAANRVRDLENALEDLRRRLKDEKRGKSNFEDLLTALRDEIERHRNEKENLRDEIVPQLQVRVDGLESEAAESQKLVYENARMHQELQSLRNESKALTNARMDMQHQSSRFTSIAEEDGPEAMASSPRIGLTRSNSTARSGGPTNGGLSRAASLTRSNSVSAKERESRESLADRVKDIEMQRDALHRALKGLLERQSYQVREHSKKVKALESERDRALEAESPRRAGFEKEVTGLRFEINQLRRRADEALVQKWQCEKGLGGLKMDLDRAEQETTSLRTLLQEHDILIPELPGRSTQDGQTSQESPLGAHATSATLERAYQELQATQALSVDKLRELWGEAPTSGEDAVTAQRMDMLLKTVNDAEVERHYAQKQAQIYHAKIESLQEAESFASGESAGLADALKASAKRAESLAGQVRLQLQSNGSLRERLADAVGKGEAAQKSSTDRINNMQAKLKALEDKLTNAQQHSEEAFAQHEEEVRHMRDSHNQQLQRLRGGLKTPTMHSPRTPLSPLFSARSPRLDKTTSGQGMSMNEALRTQSLEKRVMELEAALGDADKEMEEVVSRMNLAQIEVMELQSARDEAMRQTRKLQAAIIAEREKVDSLMK